MPLYLYTISFVINFLLVSGYLFYDKLNPISPDSYTYVLRITAIRPRPWFWFPYFPLPYFTNNITKSGYPEIASCQIGLPRNSVAGKLGYPKILTRLNQATLKCLFTFTRKQLKFYLYFSINFIHQKMYKQINYCFFLLCVVDIRLL